MRHPLLTIGAMAALSLASPNIVLAKSLGPAATDAMPPTEITVTMDGSKAVCSPSEIALPADTNITLTITSHATSPVIITMAGQFENGLVLHSDGDIVHNASEKGYTIKQNGKGILKLRTMPAGEHAYGCASINDQKEPFTGKVVLSPPA